MIIALVVRLTYGSPAIFLRTAQSTAGNDIAYRPAPNGRAKRYDLGGQMTARIGLSKVLLATGAILLLAGALASSDWGAIARVLGGVSFAAGALILASSTAIDVVSWLVRLGWRQSEPAWDGEILHTDGSEHKIRYDFDERGSPRFIAADVCAAIGVSPPTKDALRCDGVPLAKEGKHVYFMEDGVQAYLAPIAAKNRAASRLLVLIRNSVLRKIEKHREDPAR